MKALSIEDIVKIAQNNEPIYLVALVDDTDGLFPLKAYYFPVVVYENNSDEVACFQMFNNCVNGLIYLVEDYGTKWLAYKNKEQAECESEFVAIKGYCEFCKHNEARGLYNHNINRPVCEYTPLCLKPKDYCSRFEK